MLSEYKLIESRNGKGWVVNWKPENIQKHLSITE